MILEPKFRVKNQSLFNFNYLILNRRLGGGVGVIQINGPHGTTHSAELLKAELTQNFKPN